jgi:hypothetical protein
VETLDLNKVYPPGHPFAPTPYSQPGYEQWYNGFIREHGVPPPAPPPPRDFTKPPSHPSHMLPLGMSEAPSEGTQVAGLTPPYGTRREPGTNPVRQESDDLGRFIRESMRQEEYRDMPEVARDVNEQADMIRGAAPRMHPDEIMRLLEEQMKGQGYMLPPPAPGYIDPEDEEEVYMGRRFG